MLSAKWRLFCLGLNELIIECVLYAWSDLKNIVFFKDFR